MVKVTQRFFVLDKKILRSRATAVIKLKHLQIDYPSKS